MRKTHYTPRAPQRDMTAMCGREVRGGDGTTLQTEVTCQDCREWLAGCTTPTTA